MTQETYQLATTFNESSLVGRTARLTPEYRDKQYNIILGKKVPMALAEDRAYTINMDQVDGSGTREIGLRMPDGKGTYLIPAEHVLILCSDEDPSPPQLTSS